jgi:hypothetical protein
MKLFSTCLILFFSLNIYSQKFDWKGRLGGLDADSSVNIQVDKSGNVYTSGIFYGEIDLNQDTVKSNNFNSKGLSDFYIQKTNPFGEFIWGKQFGADSIDRITNVKYFDNKLFIVGQFSKTIQLDNVELKSKGGLDAFLAVIDTSGKVLWANAYGGATNDRFTTISVNESGIYTSGLFNGNIMDTTTNGSLLMSKIKLDGSQIVWRKVLSDSYKIKPNSSAFDLNGNLILAGSFAGEKIDFNPSKKDSLLSSEKKPSTTFYTQDAFILKLNSDGEFIFAKKIGGTTGNEVIYDLNSFKGTIVVTGQIAGSVLFGGVNGKTIASKGGEDIFVASYNDNFELNWVKNTGGAKNDLGKSICLDSNLNIYITGSFFDTDGKGVDFGGVKLYSFASTNAFIWKMKSTGENLYSGSFGGKDSDNGIYIYANDEEEIFATGVFESEATFYDQKLKSAGKSDVYIIKSISNREYGFVIDYAINGVNPESVPFRLEVYKKDIGNLPWYNRQFLLTNANDSDGENNSSNIVSIQGPVDFSILSATNYASIACSDFKIQKKDDWFLPSKEELDLMYLNRIKIGGLKDYPYWSSTETDLNNSVSINFTDGQINSGSNKAERKYVRPVRKKMKNDGLNVNNVISFEIAPNPTNGQSIVLIDQKYVQNGVNVEILNTSGQLIHRQNQNQNLINIDLSNYENGLYIIKLYNDSFNGITKVIKE